MKRRRAERQLITTAASFGMGIEDYSRMFDKQGGACAVCRLPGIGKGTRHQPLCIDHCHATGKVRGLLCDKCNLGIGNFNDDPARLDAAAAYVRQHQHT